MQSKPLLQLMAQVPAAPTPIGLADLPGTTFRPAPKNDGDFFWFPKTLPNLRSIYLASSRLGRQPEQHPTWFDALRTFAIHADSEAVCLLSAAGTTTHRFVERISEVYQLPMIVIQPFPKQVSADWIHQQTHQGSHTSSKLTHTAWHFDSGGDSRGIDRLLTQLATEVRVLKVRKGGNIDLAVRERLKSNVARTWVLMDEQLSKSEPTQGLVDAGATAWWLYDEPKARVDLNGPSDQPDRHRAEILSLNQIDCDSLLLHWTRRRHGPWPDQSEDAYLDDLIFREPANNHQPGAALGRILAIDRILGSSELTRDKTPVVCLADVRLDQQPKLRRFRQHLNRWDFEPYGIAIRRESIRQMGGRPAIYGDDAKWESLPDVDRPFFQVANSGEGTLDWQFEKEWRVLGNLNLNLIGPDSAFVFVPTQQAAERIAELSRWPVVVIG